jgi:hypothetical protein
MIMPALTETQRRRLAQIVGGATHRGGQGTSGSSPRQEEGRCGALTLAGEPCKNAAVPGSGRCRLHQLR